MTQTPDQAVSAELIALADRLADAASAVVLRHYRQAVAVDDKDDSSPVTIADREAERAIRDILAAERPGDGIIGEEHGAERSDAPLVWVVDPIDGTKAFVTGRPTFGTLIALLHNGSPVLGVIDQAVIGDRWIGAVGHPTRLNGSPCRTRACPSLDRAILATTAPDPFSAAGAAAFDRLRRDIRFPIYGGDCLNYGLLAGGFLDLGVGVGEGQAEARREAAADTGLARAHQPDQHDGSVQARKIWDGGPARGHGVSSSCLAARSCSSASRLDRTDRCAPVVACLGRRR